MKYTGPYAHTPHCTNHLLFVHRRACQLLYTAALACAPHFDIPSIFIFHDPLHDDIDSELLPEAVQDAKRQQVVRRALPLLVEKLNVHDSILRRHAVILARWDRHLFVNVNTHRQYLS